MSLQDGFDGLIGILLQSRSDQTYTTSNISSDESRVRELNFEYFDVSNSEHSEEEWQIQGPETPIFNCSVAVVARL